jgi:parallel beta-helix repeat protein
VRGGKYTEKITISHSGSPNAPIIISSYPKETVVMDGSGLDPHLPTNTTLVTLVGSYITFENIELTYSNGRGVYIAKDEKTGQDSSHNIIRNLNIHHIRTQGIAVWGSNNLIENNKIWQTDKVNEYHDTFKNGGWPGALTFGDSSHRYYGLTTTIRNNEVYQNYGEGILGMYTENALIDGNRVWDNWAEGIYLDQCSSTTIKNNISFYTNDHEFWRYPTTPADGILVSNEGLIKNPSHPIGHNRIIFNNIIINAGAGIGFWTGLVAGSALNNDIITNNTIVSNILNAIGIGIGLPKDANHQNTIIEYNLVLVSKGDPGFSKSITGVTFSHNLWSKKPESSAIGSGDIVGDPQLINPNHAIDLNQISHPVSAAWYQLKSSSPAIDKASVIAFVTKDLLGISRGKHPDFGALEYHK